MTNTNSNQRVLIIGGGFAGLNAARHLGKAGCQVTLIDKNNYHLFQPLLYQVATGSLAPGDIAAPIRSIIGKYENVTVIQDEAVDLDPVDRKLTTKNGNYFYDKLIIATGVAQSYFGHDEWKTNAPGLKSIEDATSIRAKVLRAFEKAEQTEDPELRKEYLSFVIVGGGPTGVELSGALAELARKTLKGEFKKFNSADIKITLVEGGPRIIETFKSSLSQYAKNTLSDLGVTVMTNSKVVLVGSNHVDIKTNETVTNLKTYTVLWAAGVKASVFSATIAKKTQAPVDRIGRILVLPNLSIPNYPEIFVLGDIASVMKPDGTPLPGLAPVAIQQGKYIADSIIANINGQEVKPFVYFDKGNMAVIGRGQAVAETWKLSFSGFPAWIAWALIHIYYLIEFENKVIVFFHWFWNYLTNNRGSRLITGSS